MSPWSPSAARERARAAHFRLLDVPGAAVRLRFALAQDRDFDTPEAFGRLVADVPELGELAGASE